MEERNRLPCFQHSSLQLVPIFVLKGSGKPQTSSVSICDSCQSPVDYGGRRHGYSGNTLHQETGFHGGEPAGRERNGKSESASEGSRERASGRQARQGGAPNPFPPIEVSEIISRQPRVACFYRAARVLRYTGRTRFLCSGRTWAVGDDSAASCFRSPLKQRARTLCWNHDQGRPPSPTPVHLEVTGAAE